LSYLLDFSFDVRRLGLDPNLTIFVAVLIVIGAVWMVALKKPPV
jgi:hypothetical protein